MNPLIESVIPDLEDEYEILGELGRGGTAIVYHARDRELGRDVAIKIVAAQHFDDGEALARMEREAKLVAQLNHPNVVALLGVRHLAAGLAMIMQHVPGRTLKRAIREDGPLAIDAVEHILHDIACALEYAHRRHIVHRDIKPENIYLDVECGRALLADFGIARTTESESTLTLVGTALGTPAYMSPEQIDGLALDARSDLYSLGLVAHEMLTGQQPWAGCNLYTIIYRQKHDELPPLTHFRSDIPPYLLHAVQSLLHKDREQRCFDAAEVLAMLPTPPNVTFQPQHFEQSAPPITMSDDTPTIRYQHDAVEQVLVEDVAVAQPVVEEYVEPVVMPVLPEVQPVEMAEPVAVVSVAAVETVLAEVEAPVKRPATRAAFTPVKPRRRYVLAGTLGLVVLGATGMVAMMNDGSNIKDHWETIPNVAAAPARPISADSIKPAPHNTPIAQQHEYATAPQIVASAHRETESTSTIDPPPAPRITLPTIDNKANAGDFTMPDVARGIANLKAASRAAVAPSPIALPELSNREDVQRALQRYYPALLRENGVAGTVLLSLLISPRGTVVGSRIDTSSGVTALDEAALQVAKVMRFTASSASRQKDSVWVQLPVRFEVH